MEISIYHLVDPSNGLIRYVGQSKDPKRRLADHMHDRYLKSNNRKNNWLKKLKGLNLVPEMEIIDVVCSEEEANDLEIFWIVYYKYIGMIIYNGTTGGQYVGFRFVERHKLNDEQRARQTATMKEGYASGRIVHPLIGTKMTDKAKAHLSKVTNFRYLPQESIDKRAATNTGKKRNDEQKANLSKGNLNQFVNEINYKIIKVFKVVNEEFIGYCVTPTEAATMIGTHNVPNVSACLKGKIKTTQGHYLRYGTEEETDDELIKRGLKIVDEECKRLLDRIDISIINFESIIIEKDFFKGLSEDKLKKYALQIKHFLLSNFPDFPFPIRHDFTPKDILAVQKNKNEIFMKTDRMFKNYGAFSASTQFLKSIFHSFYYACNRNNKSVVEKYENDIDLLKVIEYRIGINKSDELWDLSFHNIVKGYSATRGLVSFFKPAVASSIYDNIPIKIDTVLDPCCGFGGRMLGYFVSNPKGRYIGCEPNKDTYKELLLLKCGLEIALEHPIDAVLYNVTIEEFVELALPYWYPKIDFTFTSIPYYDLESYSQDIVKDNYENFDDWKNKFIGALLKLPNCWINMPIELFNKLELKSTIEPFLLRSNAAKHISQKTEFKDEYIIRIN